MRLALGCLLVLMRADLFSTEKPSDGRKVYVELWETTPDQAPRLIWKNMERLPVEATAAGRTVTAYVPQLSPPSMPTRQDVLAQQLASMQLYEQQVAAAVAAHPPCPSYTYQNVGGTIGASSYSTNATQYQVPRDAQSYSVAAQPYSAGGHYYLPGSNRLPTNPDRGTVRTEYRGVFVSNLSYDTTEDDLHQLFSRLWTVRKIDFKKEEKTNSKGKTATRCKGSAVVTFETAEDAESAIQALKGRSFKGRELTIRYDTEATPVNMTSTTNGSSSSGRRSQRTNDAGTPLIVDGSIYGNSR